MTIEFEKIEKRVRVYQTTRKGMNFNIGNIKRTHFGIEFNGITLEELEQILSKMKELQS